VGIYQVVTVTEILIGIHQMVVGGHGVLVLTVFALTIMDLILVVVKQTATFII
jgi:hypothetical protein